MYILVHFLTASFLQGKKLVSIWNHRHPCRITHTVRNIEHCTRRSRRGCWLYHNFRQKSILKIRNKLYPVKIIFIGFYRHYFFAIVKAYLLTSIYLIEAFYKSIYFFRSCQYSAFDFFLFFWEGIRVRFFKTGTYRLGPVLLERNKKIQMADRDAY